MKLIELKCPNCSSTMQVNNDTKEVVCDFCGAKFAVDDEAQHIHYDNAEQAGYEFEKGRQKAQAEQFQNIQGQQSYVQPKKRKTWLWVLGWIFIFPVPLTIILLKKKEMNKWLRIGIIAITWIVYLILGFAGGSYDTNSTVPNNETATEPTSIIEQTENSVDGETAVESIVKTLNSSLENDIEFVENFEVQDNSNSHYRHEFRLDAYKDAIGKSYKYEDANVDIIVRTTYSRDLIIRIYANGTTLNQCSELIKASASIYDTKLTEDDVEATIKQLTNTYSSGVESIGDMIITLQGNEKNGYELMIKASGD